MTSKLDNSKMQFLTLRQFADKNPWPTEMALRSIFARRHKNGMEKAFVRRGRRIIVNEEKFFELMSNNEIK